MIFLVLKTLLLATFCFAQEPWTKKETIIVKDKLRFIFTHPESVKEQFFELYPNHEFKTIFTDKFHTETFPTAAKFLRLGFHDCLPYEDSEGGKNGCDGCLNFNGMGKDHENLTAQGMQGPSKFSTDNNGLWWTVEILEEIYTNRRFPIGEGIKKLDISLKKAGKSRADLWAFATMVAVEWGIENQNKGCDGEQMCKIILKPKAYQVVIKLSFFEQLTWAISKLWSQTASSLCPGNILNCNSNQVA